MTSEYWVFAIVTFLFVLSVKKYFDLQSLRESIEEYIAEIAFVGRAPGKYNIHLGGGFIGDRIGGIWQRSAKADDIAGLLRPVLERYSKERNEGEKFGDFVIRVGIIHEVTHGSEVHKEHSEE